MTSTRSTSERPRVTADLVSPPTDRMRIGLMLRGIDEVDGSGIYIRKLCDALFEEDRHNQYVAFYSRPEQAGRYRDRPNVREVVVPGGHKLWWDQVLVPLAARREGVDVLFHHKFSIPLVAHCPAVVQQRGTEYWSHPEFYPDWYSRMDQLYNRVMIPLYCRRAVRVLTNSDTLGDELVRHAGVPRAKLGTVYAAADESFQPITDHFALERARERYRLPREPFLVMVVKGHQIWERVSGKALTPRKNVAVVLEAYGRLQRRLAERRTTAPPLVILGIGIAERLTPAAISEHAEPGSVFTPGFVDLADMPAVYAMARALVFPSRYESFGIPIVEAMACGCPVVTANTSACPEVAGDAALLVDPDDVPGIAAAMEQISLDDELAAELRMRGLRRARDFSWAQSARTLMAELRSAASRAWAR